VPHKILVPLDGSELAERALAYATALAGPTGAKLLLVRVAFAHTLAGVDGRERRVGAIHEAEQYLSQVRADLRERDFRVDTLVPYGHPAECIADQARIQSADLIVMSTHGRTGASRLLFGSVAESVVARTSVPVLLERAWRPLVHEPRFDRRPALVVPLDGSEFSEAALGPAAELAAQLGAGLVLIHIETSLAPLTNSLHYLESARTKVAAGYPTLAIETEVRCGDNPPVELERALMQTRPTLVVMATHGRSGIRRALIGSVAGHILRQGSIPLVLVRPDPAQETDELAAQTASVG
jgi:nucleotide-binding universal stress UspA family protein